MAGGGFSSESGLETGCATKKYVAKSIAPGKESGPSTGHGR